MVLVTEMSLARYCFLLAFMVWALGLRVAIYLMVSFSIFLIFDWTFGGDPRQKQ
jgi:hypothetical protein